MDLSDLKQIVFMLGFIALIGGAIAISMGGFSKAISRPSGTVTNESISTQTLANDVQMFNNELVSIQTVTNRSNNYKLSSTTDYSVVNAGTVNAAFHLLNGSFNSTTLDVNYTYNTKPAAYNITNNGAVGIYNSTSYLDVTGTISAVAVLIGIVVIAFGFMNRE